MTVECNKGTHTHLILSHQDINVPSNLHATGSTSPHKDPQKSNLCWEPKQKSLTRLPQFPTKTGVGPPTNPQKNVRQQLQDISDLKGCSEDIGKTERLKGQRMECIPGPRNTLPPCQGDQLSQSKCLEREWKMGFFLKDSWLCRIRKLTKWLSIPLAPQCADTPQELGQ